MSVANVVVVDETEVGARYLLSAIAMLPRMLGHAFPRLDEALAWAKEHPVDTFVVAYPGFIDGDPDLVRTIRADALFAQTPIVVLAGTHQEQLRAQTYLQGANDFIVRPAAREELTARMGRLLALYQAARAAEARQTALMRALDEHERRSRGHVKRLETLWRVANETSLTHDVLIRAMLTEATAAIRPGQPFYGQLVRVDGDTIEIVEAVTEKDTFSEAALGLAAAGARFPFAKTAVAEVMRLGITRSWDDIAGDPTLATAPRLQLLGWRSVIATPFHAVGVTYVLAFFARSPSVEPFTAEDHAYVELLASFFASRFQSEWQRERLQYQNAHDVLTGLVNGAYFRSSVRAALHETERFAIVVVTIAEFARINAAHGFQTGDALLVEVAAELRRTAGVGEIVGRLSGDAFALFVPEPANGTTVDERIAVFRAIFPRGFSTGDREGKEFVTLDARFGVAHGPAHGTTYDALLSRAAAEAAPGSAPAEPSS
jgi:diguanylate cyclase (GGDEF)-like protein